MVEEEYDMPRPHLPYSTYYRRPYPRAVYTTAGAGYAVPYQRMPISRPAFSIYNRPYARGVYTMAGAGYARRPFR